MTQLPTTSDSDLQDWEVIETASIKSISEDSDSNSEPPIDEVPTGRSNPRDGEIQSYTRSPPTSLPPTAPPPPTPISTPCKPTPKARSKKPAPDPRELHPCSACHSFHYIPTCAYQLTWTAWLDYHRTYLSSQPYVFPDGVTATSSLASSSSSDRRHRARPATPPPAPTIADPEREYADLHAQAAELDRDAWRVRPNYLSNTRLKADLMSPSSRGMFWDDEFWRAKLEAREAERVGVGRREVQVEEEAGKAKMGVRVERRDLPVSIEEQQLMLWQEELDAEWAREVAEVDDVESESEEEDAFSTLRADLGRHLPRTSWATLVPPARAGSAATEA